MEVGAHERLAEVERPNLGAELGHIEIEMGTQTRSIAEWMKMCPVPLDDPRMTVEAINARVTKMINHQGAEVDPEYAEHLTYYSQQQGVEPRFSIAAALAPEVAPVKTPVAERSQPAKEAPVTTQPSAETNESAPVAIEVLPVQLPTEVVEPIWSREEEAAIVVSERTEAAMAQQEAVIIPLHVVEEPPSVEAPLVQVEVSSPTLPVRVGVAVEKQVPDIRSDITSSQTEHTVGSNAQSISHEEAPDAEQDMHIVRYDSPESMPVVEDGAAAEGMDIYTPPQQPTYSSQGAEVIAFQPDIDIEAPEPTDADQWLDALRQPPEQLLQDMATAFNGLVESSNEHVSTLPIVLTTQERLQTMLPDDELVVAPLVHNIIGVVHGLEVMAEQGADDELVGIVESQLREACVALLDSLAIAYDRPSLEALVDIFQQPHIKQLLIGMIDLEKRGTHEVKTFKNEIVAHVWQSPAFQGLLGRTALLPQRKPLMVS